LNAQGSRGIIVDVQVGMVKIYVAAVQALRIKESHGETKKNHHVKLQKFTLPNIKKKERKKEKKKLHANILFMTLSTIVKLLSNEIERLKECL